jgi:hypothetical protein
MHLELDVHPAGNVRLAVGVLDGIAGRLADRQEEVFHRISRKACCGRPSPHRPPHLRQPYWLRGQVQPQRRGQQPASDHRDVVGASVRVDELARDSVDGLPWSDCVGLARIGKVL